MAEERAQNRLAAILAADVVGHGQLMEERDAGTLAALKEWRRNVLEWSAIKPMSSTRRRANDSRPVSKPMTNKGLKHVKAAIDPDRDFGHAYVLKGWLT